MKSKYKKESFFNTRVTPKSKVLKKGLLLTMLGLSVGAYAQTKQQKNQITKSYDKSKLISLAQKYSNTNAAKRAEALRIAGEKGWKTSFTTEDGKFYDLQEVVNGKPIYYTTYNTDAARSTRTNHLHNGGTLDLDLTGDGLTAHVWDGGIARASHQEYDGAGGNNRYTVGDRSTKLSSHAAHVTGTIIASGVRAEAKGMAPHANAVGYFWDNDVAEATNAAADGMLLSNHSYGFGFRDDNNVVVLPQHRFGGYSTHSRNWDEVLFNAPNYLAVIAAGNDGDDNSANENPTGGFGYDKLNDFATSKNTLVVANAADAIVDANGNLVSVAINSSSSEGPTDDFRIKPDITGNGTEVFSTYHNTNSHYNTISGTSMASPNVTGSLLLLQEHYNNLNNSFMKAATLKGLALHTADDAGVTGPDAVFGWGLLNAKRAAEVIINRNTQSKIEELTLTAGESYTITVNSDGNSPLMASISWTDRAGTANTIVNSTTPVLVNDLDIRVSREGTEYLPYKLVTPLTSARRDNNVDPYERVDIADASGTYTITISYKGTLTGGSQNYSLIVTGIVDSTEDCTVTAVPENLSIEGVNALEATLKWDAVTGNKYDVRYREVGSSSWTVIETLIPSVILRGLDPETQYQAQIRSKCDADNSAYSTAINFTTTAITYCESGGNSVDDEYIRRVQLGSIDNQTTNATGYTDHTSLSTNLAKGQEHSITITPGWTGNAFDDGYAVYIDYNRDGDFYDEGETVWTKSPSKTTPVSTTFEVPADAVEGATRMRISLAYESIAAACGSFRFGETEDYTVVIQAEEGDTQAPTAPTNLTATNIEQTTVTLSWNAATDNVGVTVYDVYRGTVHVASVTDTTMNVTDLTPSTDYTFSVRAKDAAENTSEAATVSFTTASEVVDVTYCASSGSSATDESGFEWIDHVSLGGMTNSSGNDNGYGDYTDRIARVTRGTETELVISAGFGGRAYTEFWAIWIDFNQNGVFESGERVASGDSSSSGLLSANIDIPASAVLGTTRMRVSMNDTALASPCDRFTYGEVEDYTVEINNVAITVATTDAITNEDTVGLGHNGVGMSFSVYPNPSKNNIVLSVTNLENASYSIKNMLGQTVLANKVSKEEINISDLRAGLYIITVTDGQKSFTKKLIKQ